MKTKLKNICDFVKDKISVGKIIADNYISTENMIPDKCGITSPSSIPTGIKVTAYRKNDVLVSNIRPYFKKIWFAENDGGCSNDVLVFRAKSGISPDFLYYILANDRFFDYAMKTSKGTKMPRGDKKAIMEYIVPVPDYETQKKTGYLLSLLDRKIELNNKINKNLEQQAQSIFKSWFVDFEPFGYVMPKDWRMGVLSEIAEIKSGKRPPLKQTEKTETANIQIVGATSVMGFTNNYNHNEKILIIGRVGTHGVVQRFNCPCWASDNTLVIKTHYYEYVYQLLKQIDYNILNRGSTQPLITQGDMNKVNILIPNLQILIKYENIITTLMNQYENNKKENQCLSVLRDVLIPKLINGEIDISKIQI